MTAQEKADELWETHNYYWHDENLIAKQRISLHIGQIVSELRVFGIEKLDYWIEVRLLIYNK